MLAVNYSTYRENLKKYCDTANIDSETVIVTRKQGGNVVMISEDQYNNLMENMFVRKNKKAYNRLLESIEQLKAGNIVKKELADE